MIILLLSVGLIGEFSKQTYFCEPQEKGQTNPPSGNFRVYPYLQLSSSGDLWISWFADKPHTSSISIFQEGRKIAEIGSISAILKNELDYTLAEKNQEIVGLSKSSWLMGEKNYKYTGLLEGLLPNSSYEYEVMLNGEVFKSDFRTAPTEKDWNSITFVALSDSETEPLGRLTRREWEPGRLAPGSLPRPSTGNSKWVDVFGEFGPEERKVLRYMLTETVGFQENLNAIQSIKPNFMIVPGDLVQGGGYQPGWDEFFIHHAGELGVGISKYPIIPALGNWDNFGALNGGYGIDAEGRFAPKFSRDKFFTYWDAPKRNDDETKNIGYYRVDYGPVTILTLDSSNGLPEDSRSNYQGDQKIKGTTYSGPGTDTQENINAANYALFGGTDMKSFHEGSDQWDWTRKELQSSKEKGQLIFVQFHHAPFSNGEHGLPMNHELSSGQGGTPMRVYHPLFEEFGVIAVFSGHNEIFERSFVDLNNDGKGVHYYDVGVAGDGLRGERKAGSSLDSPLLKYNEYSKWTADQSEPEKWELVNGVLQLTAGGKHYGHLEVKLEKRNESGRSFAEITFSPVYIFPFLDGNYNLVRTERRIYEDVVRLNIELEDLEVPLVPVFKSKETLYLNSLGRVKLEVNKLVENWDQLDSTFTFTASKEEFSCEDISLGPHLITIDSFLTPDNVTETAIEIMVLDTLPPTLEVRDFTLFINPTIGKVTIAQEDIVVLVDDNCGIENIEISQLVVSCTEITEVEVRIIAFDSSGNKTERVSNVSIKWDEAEPIRIIGEELICEGEQIELSVAAGEGYRVVAWYKDNVRLEGEDGISLNVTEAGEYKVELISDLACIIFTPPFLVEIEYLPSGQILVSSNILQAPEGDFLYKWYFNDVLLEETRRFLVVNQMGKYNVLLTNNSTLSCFVFLEPVWMTITGLDANKEKWDAEMSVFPNPSRDEVTVKFSKQIYHSIEQVQVSGVDGKESLISPIHSNILDNSLQFSLKSLPNGLYLLVVRTDEGFFLHRKIVKQ